MRDCARYIDREYCGRPSTTTRVVTTMTVASALDDLAYLVDMCAEHALEYDQEAM